MALLAKEQKTHHAKHLDHKKDIKSLRTTIADTKEQKILESLKNSVKELAQSLQTWGSWINPVMTGLPVELKALQAAYQKQQQTITGMLLIMPALKSSLAGALTDVEQRLSQLSQLESSFLEAQTAQKQQEQHVLSILQSEWRIAEADLEEQLAPFVPGPLAEWAVTTTAVVKDLKAYDSATQERYQLLQQRLFELVQYSTHKRVQQIQLQRDIAVIQGKVLQSIGDDQCDEKTVLQWSEQLNKVQAALTTLTDDSAQKAAQAQLQGLRLAYDEQKQALNITIPMLPPSVRAGVEAALAETLKKLESLATWEKSFAEQCITQASQDQVVLQSLQAQLQTAQIQVSKCAAELDQPGASGESTTAPSPLTVLASAAKLEGILNQNLLERDQMTPWVERIQKEPLFSKELFKVIEHSKTEAKVAIAAANAITLLNAAGVSLSGYDFSGVRIPGADLSGALLERTKFDKADLREVNFQDAWLRGASFKGAQVQGLRFGEFPYLIHKECDFDISPDNRLLATASNPIQIYAMVAQVLVRTFERSSSPIHAIAWSPSGERLASISGRNNGDIALWDIETGKVVKNCKNYCDSSTYSIAWHSSGEYFATGHYGHTHVWDSTNGKLLKILPGGSHAIIGVAWDMLCNRLASVSEYGNILISDVDEGKSLMEFRIEGRCYNVTWNPKGKRIAVGNDRGIVTVLDVEVGKKLDEFPEYGGYLNWDASGKHLAITSGYNNAIYVCWTLKLVNIWRDSYLARARLTLAA